MIEVGEGKRLDEAMVKQLTGGDKIAARFLYGEYFEYDPQFKIFLATNHKPIISDSTDSIWRRIRLVPFTVTIPDSERDLQLKEKLIAELPGILNWAVQGCLDLKNGLNPPPEVRNATKSYRHEMDILKDYLEDRCEICDSSIEKTYLYADYLSWCGRENEESLSKQKFGRMMIDHNFKELRTGKGRRWAGLKIKEAILN